MTRSRTPRVAAVAALLAFALLVATVLGAHSLFGGGGSAEHATKGAIKDVRAGTPRKRGRLTDAQAIDRVRRITPWITRGHTRRKLVALTFDDGPGPQTSSFLHELRKLKAPATFFQVAQSVNAFPPVARAEHHPPFAVGTHTATHAHLPAIGIGGQRREVDRGAATIDENSHSYPRMFRPPYGEWNQQTLTALRRHRMLMVLWTITSSDWTGIPREAIVHNVVSGVRPGSIVLMHDFGGITREPTLHALPVIVRTLRRKGYKFVTVPQMMRLAPPKRRPARPPAPYPP